jgi:hypothetical protein
MNLANFAAWQSNLTVVAVFSNKLCAVSSRSHQLCALTTGKFNRVDCGAGRDVLEWQAIADLDRSFVAAGNLVTNRHRFWRQNIVVDTVAILDTRNTARAIWIILDMFDNCGGVFGKVKVDHAVKLTDAAAFVPGGNAALVVASRGLPFLLRQ